MSCLRQAFISGAEFGRANGYAYCIQAESERYVTGRCGWDKPEGTAIELEGLKDAQGPSLAGPTVMLAVLKPKQSIS